ncbi:hypothetical protein ZHAS_00007725 [Anopheles sinensis]|uniref:Uncharacterized protein n=1 Tax=Anopheles sinensis TaxID=74873 RepID=A0A084VQK4_ANOSI|nr:hypothetical protein ZHAS_00007725 [Anopheles sinensis]
MKRGHYGFGNKSPHIQSPGSEELLGDRPTITPTRDRVVQDSRTGGWNCRCAEEDKVKHGHISLQVTDSIFNESRR